MRQGLHTPDFFTQYWGAMSGFLTELKMLFEGAITLETSLALNQLTRLQSLSLEGMGESAAIQLQLPQLKKLTLQDFDNASISLNCEQLKEMKLVELHLLQDMSGVPDCLETLQVSGLGHGSVPVEQVLPAQGLKHLVHLHLKECPGEATAFREGYVPSTLTSLTADHDWLPLLPLQAPWQGLPCNLTDVSLLIPLCDGIPLVLEQLRNLESLEVYHAGAGQMHLTRSLDHFLDMPQFVYLGLFGDNGSQEELVRWTTDALKFLGLADRRIMATRAKDFTLLY